MTKQQRKKYHRIPGHTPEQDFADELGVTKDTLRKYRRQGKGPAYIVVARQIHCLFANRHDVRFGS